MRQKQFSILIVIIMLAAVTMTFWIGKKQMSVSVSDDHPHHRVEALRGNDKEQLIRHTSFTRPLHYGELIGQQHEQQTRVLGASEQQSKQHDDDSVMVAVYIEESEEIERVPLEQYVLGVALAEVPLSFHIEAIKAQMIAARSYIIYQMKQQGEEGSSFLVSNTVRDQAYKPTIEVDEYQTNYPQQYAKFVQASNETKGLVLTYEQEVIEALYFSTSNGYTEAAEHVWGNDVPYLQSVKSNWDKQLSPSYITTVEISLEQWYERLFEQDDPGRDKKLSIHNLVRNRSGRIDSLEINDTVFSGRQIRELFNLSSTDFTWDIDYDNNHIKLTSYGYGHGVGMSQWGAEGLAQEGKLAEQILQYYYKDVQIEPFSKF